MRPFVRHDEGGKALQFSIHEIQSRTLLADPSALDLEYSRLMMGFLLWLPAPRSILMLGLGGGSLAKFCHRHLPGTRIRVVEINPHVLALRDEFQVPRDDARLAVLLGDGAMHVREPGPGCDLLMVDGFDYDGQPAALCSQAFYDDCFERLDAAGMLVVNLHRHEAEHALVLDRIGRSFHDETLVVDSSDGANSVVLAAKGFALARRSRSMRQWSRGLDPLAAAQLQPAFSRVQAAWRAATPSARPSR